MSFTYTKAALLGLLIGALFSAHIAARPMGGGVPTIVHRAPTPAPHVCNNSTCLHGPAR